MPSQKLSTYERRLWIEVDRILYQNYLTPRTISDFWAGYRDAVAWHLKQLKARIIRTIVVIEYVEVDDVLNRTILRRSGAALKARSYRVLKSLLDGSYLLQKLDAVQAAMVVPNPICNSIRALNTLRNSFAHRHDLSEVPRSKRLYKGKHDVATRRGLKLFRSDMYDVHAFFEPDTLKLAHNLMEHQKHHARSERKRAGKGA